MKVVDLVAEYLAEAGVRLAFGIPGGEVAPLVDALDRAGIRFVLTRHENAAGFMADAVYQRTGVPGVVVATLGPGVSNMVTGVAQAHLDRSAVIFLTGSVAEGLRPAYTHQVFDHSAVLRPLTKATVGINSANVEAAVRHVLSLTRAYPPGPVHLDLPVDVQTSTVERRTAVPVPGPAELPWPAGSALDGAVELLRRSRAPIIVAGLEAVLTAPPESVQRFAERMGAPVLTTYKAKGLLPEDHPLAAGAIGLSPVFDAIARDRVAAADLVVLLGLDGVELRSDWLSAWSGVPSVEVGRAAGGQEAFAGRTVVVADVGAFLAATALALGRQTGLVATAAAAANGDGAAAAALGMESPSAPGTMLPVAALAAIQDVLDSRPDATVAIDTGAFRITANHVLRASRPRQFLQSNGLGTMGYALPAAIGARLAEPGRPAVALTGDGGLAMVLGELGVLGDTGIAVAVVVFVDDSLALIELKQQRSGLSPVGVRFSRPDWAAVACAFGGVGTVARDAEALRTSLKEALEEEERFTLIAVPVDRADYGRQM